MEIINRPKGHCPKCGTTFVYDSGDIKYNKGGKHTPYLECPGCKSRLTPYSKTGDEENWKIMIIGLALIVAGFFIGFAFGRL